MTMYLSELKTIIKDSAVAGAGGAGFPSYAKLDERADTILLNCAECEPLLKLHRQVLEKYALEIMKALEITAKALGAKQIKICLKGSYTGALQAVKSYIDAFENMSVVILPEVYPAGDEVVLIYEATGRRVPPGGIPILVGCVVFNVETMLNIYKAVEKNEPVTHKYITVAGEVENPKTFLALIGTTYGELIDICKKTIDDCCIIAGGPMTGRLANESDVVTKTSNAVLVMPKNHYIVTRRKLKASIGMKRAMSACCQCRMCSDLCPRHQLGYPIEPSEFMRAASSGTVRDTQKMLDTFFCSQCGLCEMFACNQLLSPKTLIGEYKNNLRKNGVKMPKRELKEVSEQRKMRYVSMSRLTARLDLTKYNKNADLDETKINVNRVKLMMSQHIGAPAVPVVKAGDFVKENDIIAQAAKDALSINVHTPVSGKVAEANEKFVVIDVL